MIELGNQLILDLEDIIHHVANTFGSWGTISLGRNKSYQEQHIRTKCLNLKDEFKNFQDEIRNLEIYNINKENEVFKVVDDYSLDQLITDFMVANDINKFIDDAHNICYKLRKLVIYLEE